MPSATLLINPTLTAAVGPYYTLFPTEPTPSDSPADWLSLGAGRAVGLKTEQLDDLLQVIAGKVSAGGNVLIAGHGNDQGIRFFIGDRRRDIRLEFALLEHIRRNQEGKESDEDTAKYLVMSVDDWRKLRQRIVAVQNLALNRVDVRACNTGRNDVAMSALQVFFNCNIFCAPKLLDSFGAIKFQPFAKNPADFDNWLAKHGDAAVTGSSPNRFALAMHMTGVPSSDAIAESPDGAKAWASAFLPPGNAFTGKNELFYHALTDRTAVFFAGEKGFRAQLVEALRGKEPSRTIDVNQPLSP